MNEFINPTTFINQDIPLIIFFSLLNFIIPKFLVYLFKYLKIEFNEKTNIEWTNRIISTINAIVTTILSCYCIITYDQWALNPHTSTSKLSNFILRFISWYFIYDTIVSFVYYKYLFSIGITIHHIIGISSITILGGCFGKSHPLLLLYVFTEITTPLINLRFFLLDANLKDSLLYKINGILILIGFVIVRDLYVPINIYKNITDPQFIHLISPLTSLYFKTVFPLITILNLYWTFSIFKGIIKFFFVSKNKSKAA